MLQYHLRSSPSFYIIFIVEAFFVGLSFPSRKNTRIAEPSLCCRLDLPVPDTILPAHCSLGLPNAADHVDLVYSIVRSTPDHGYWLEEVFSGTYNLTATQDLLTVITALNRFTAIWALTIHVRVRVLSSDFYSEKFGRYGATLCGYSYSSQ